MGLLFTWLFAHCSYTFRIVFCVDADTAPETPLRVAADLSIRASRHTRRLNSANHGSLMFVAALQCAAWRLIISQEMHVLSKAAFTREALLPSMKPAESGRNLKLLLRLIYEQNSEKLLRRTDEELVNDWNIFLVSKINESIGSLCMHMLPFIRKAYMVCVVLHRVDVPPGIRSFD